MILNMIMKYFMMKLLSMNWRTPFWNQATLNLLILMVSMWQWYRNWALKYSFFCWLFSMHDGNIMCGHGLSHESSSYANQTKRDMMIAPHINHFQSPAISAKRWTEYLQLESNRDVNGRLEDKQEGFRLKRNTTWLVYRLHLMLENAKR